LRRRQQRQGEGCAPAEAGLGDWSAQRHVIAGRIGYSDKRRRAAGWCERPSGRVAALPLPPGR